MVAVGTLGNKERKKERKTERLLLSFFVLLFFQEKTFLLRLSSLQKSPKKKKKTKEDKPETIAKSTKKSDSKVPNLKGKKKTKEGKLMKREEEENFYLLTNRFFSLSPCLYSAGREVLHSSPATLTTK